MSRPKLDDEVSGFADWLVEKHHKSVNTASAYSSAVRYVMRNAKLSGSSDEAYVYAMYCHQRKDHTQKKTAWLWFCTYRGVEPTHWYLKSSSIGHEDRLQPIPDLPEDVLFTLLRYREVTKLPVQAFTRANWRDVRQTGGTYMAKFNGENYSLSHKELTPFLAYSKFAPGMDAPFIPSAPGGGLPYPDHLLQLQLREFKMSVQTGKHIPAEIAVQQAQPPAITPARVHDRMNPPKSKPVDASKWDKHKVKITAMLEEDPWEYMQNVPEEIKAAVIAELEDES